MTHKDEIRTQTQAADYCHCSTANISCWVNRGWLKKSEDGFFYREDLNECVGRAICLSEKLIKMNDNWCAISQVLQKARNEIVKLYG